MSAWPVEALWRTRPHLAAPASKREGLQLLPHLSSILHDLDVTSWAPPLSKCPLDSIQAAPDQSMAAVLAHEKLVNAHLPHRKLAHSGLQGNLKAAARPTGARRTRMNLELKWRPGWESETHCFHKKIPTQTVFLPIPASPQGEYLARE